MTLYVNVDPLGLPATTSTGVAGRGERIEIVDLTDADQALIDTAVLAVTDAGDAPADYADWTVPAIRAELDIRGLDTDGKKPELVDRLRADDATVADPPATTEPDVTTTTEED